MKKNEKKHEKKHEKKTEVFYVFWIFQKWAKNRPFWWPPRLSGGRAGNPPKWKLWGAFPYKNLCKGNFGAARSPKWNLWETSAILVMLLVISKVIINRINK